MSNAFQADKTQCKKVENCNQPAILQCNEYSSNSEII